MIMGVWLNTILQ